MGSTVVQTRALTAFFAVLCFVFLVIEVSAQGTTGVHGTVTDNNGAVIPGATVVLSNPASGFTRTIVADSNGAYNFPGLQPATYKIEVTAKGFKKLINSNVKALVDSPNELNLTMEPGDVSVVVDV